MAKKFAGLRAKMRPAARATAARKTHERLAEMPLRDLRHARSLSQQTLAKAMGTSQGEISKIETRVDMYVSTLRSYVEAMGGKLDIVATFSEGRYEINQFSDLVEPDLKKATG